MHRYPTFLRRFAADTRGSVLILFGLAVIILIAAAGAGIDFGRQSLIRGKMQASADLAATSAGGFEKADGSLIPDPDRENVGDRYYALNFRKPYMSAASGATNNITTIANGIIKVDPSLDAMKADFTSLSGTDELAVDGQSKVGFSGKPPQAMDVLLVLDTSGSMSNPLYADPNFPNRLAAAKAAAKALTNTLLTPANSAALPASQQRRVGLIVWGYLPSNPTGSATLVSNFTSVKTGPGGIDDAIDNMPLMGGTNSTAGLEKALQTFNLSQNAPFPNPNIAKIVVLMTDGGNNIGVPNYGNTTLGNQGVMHLYMDPNVETYLANQSALQWLMDPQHGPYYQQPANRKGSLYPNYPNFVENTRSLTACSQLKQDHVVIYTVGFGKGSWSPQDTLQQYSGFAIQNFLSSCATGGQAIPGYNFSGLPPYSFPPAPLLLQPNTNLGSYYFLPSDGADLLAAFQQIGNSIKKVRIQE